MRSTLSLTVYPISLTSLPQFEERAPRKDCEVPVTVPVQMTHFQNDVKTGF